MARITLSGLSSTSSVDNEFCSESAARDYLAKDGLLNVEKVLALTKRIEAAIKKTNLEVKANKSGRIVKVSVMAKKTNVNRVLRQPAKDNGWDVAVDDSKALTEVTIRASAALTPKDKKDLVKLLGTVHSVEPESVFVIGSKAKTAKFSASMDKNKEALTYRTRRAIKVSSRRKVGMARLILPVYPKGLLTPALDKEIGFAATAITSHVKKIDSVKEKIGNDRTKIREQKAADYSKVVEEVKSIFAGQIPDSKMVLGKTMMGAETLYVQLPSKKVITVGLSDLPAMRKAIKLSSESSFESESSSRGLYYAYDTLSEAIWSAFDEDATITLDDKAKTADIVLSNGTKTTYDFNTKTFANGVSHDFGALKSNVSNVKAAKQGASGLRSVSQKQQ